MLAGARDVVASELELHHRGALSYPHRVNQLARRRQGESGRREI